MTGSHIIVIIAGSEITKLHINLRQSVVSRKTLILGYVQWITIRQGFTIPHGTFVIMTGTDKSIGQIDGNIGKHSLVITFQAIIKSFLKTYHRGVHQSLTGIYITPHIINLSIQIIDHWCRLRFITECFCLVHTESGRIHFRLEHICFCQKNQIVIISYTVRRCPHLPGSTGTYVTGIFWQWIYYRTIILHITVHLRLIISFRTCASDSPYT